MPDSNAFISLAAGLSTRFTGLEATRVDEAIERALRGLVEFLGTDRSTLFEFAPDERTLKPTYFWAQTGIQPTPAQFVMGEFPWVHSRLIAGEVVRLERLPDDLPAGAAAEREYVRQTGFKSLLIIPIAVGERYVCALSTATFRSPCPWPGTLVEQVRVVGQILANALYRKRAEDDLRAHLDEIRRLKEHLEAENVYLREEADSDAGFGEIVARSAAMREVVAQAAQVAPTGSTVLLLGETGSGKELLARFVHARSPRHDRLLVKVNCAALPATLIESELFGHERGAFTGATATRPGRFEVADGGTLFLDEIGEMPIEVQSKLLRVLQEGEFERVGSSRARKVDVRVVAATNRDLERAIAEGRFREDLYYRLNVFPIRVPPLRERREDIPLLAWAIVDRRQTGVGRRIERIPKRALDALTAYAWPGNVRELENVIERSLILSPGATLRLDEAFARAGGWSASRSDAERLERVEREHIVAVLGRCAWKIDGRGHAAEKLGLHPNTLRSRMKKLGIRRPAHAPGPR